MHPFRRLSLLLIVSAASFSTSSFARTPARTLDQPARLQVSLFNDARIDPATLAEAEARASAIFSQAGIEIDWLVCRPTDPADFSPSTSPCAALAWPAHLSVRIIPRGRKVAADVFGQAMMDDLGRGVYANIYYQNLVHSQNYPGIGAGEVLGYVIAHELGHLLLGTNSHSPSGLMQATWTPHILTDPSRVFLFFTRAQSATLRSRLFVVANLQIRSVRSAPLA